MRQHIERCQRGTQTVEQYCQEQGLSKANYYYWHKRLQKQPAGFVALNMNETISDAGVIIRFPNGISLSFEGKVNGSLIKELACCI